MARRYTKRERATYKRILRREMGRGGARKFRRGMARMKREIKRAKKRERVSVGGVRIW